MSRMISFSKQRVITDYYEVSVEEFVDKHFAEVREYKDEMDIYIDDGLDKGLLRRVMSLPLKAFKGIDIEDEEAVKSALKTYLNSEEAI